MKKRLLAMVLAVAMIIGMLPVIALAGGHANVADGVNQNILTDNFGDSRYTNGTLYQWNTKDRYEPVTRTLGNDGIYSVTVGNLGQTENNYAVTYLTARDMVNGTDYSAAWSDYSLEMTGRLNTGATTNQNKMFLMGRVQKHADGSITYYAAALRYGMNVVYLYKATIGADLKHKLTLVASGTPTIALDKFYTLKLSFDASTIKVAVDGVDYITYEDSDYACGSVGFAMTRDGSMTIDSIKVTHDDDASVFVEDFTDDRYFNGTVVKWNPDGADIWEIADGIYGAEIVNQTPVAVTAKWNNRDRYPDTTTRTNSSADGYMEITNTKDSASEANFVMSYLTLATADSEATAQWRNYSVEASLKLGSAKDNKTKLVVMGRVQVDENGAGTYYAAGLRYGVNTVYLYKGTFNGSSTNSLTQIATAAAGTTLGADTFHAIKMTFNENNIKVYLGDEEKISYDIPDETTSAGGVGVVMTRQGAAAVDSITVKDLNGVALFEEDFSTDARFAGESGYMLGDVYNVGAIPGADGDITEVNAQWSEAARYPTQITKTFELDGEAGAYKIVNANTGASDKAYAYSYLSLKDAANTDLAKQWSNYAVEIRGRIETGVSNQAKLLVMGNVQFDASGSATFYAAGLRHSAATAYLYKGTLTAASGVVDVKLTQIATAAVPGLDTTEYHTVKLAFNPVTVKVYVDGDEKISADIEPTIASGGVGIMTVRGITAYYDSIKVTNAEGNTLFEDDFSYADTAAFTTAKAGYLYEGAFTVDKPQVEAAPQLPGQKTDSLNLISATSGAVDFAQSWKDYAMDVDFLLENDKSAASIVARATAAGYYELRVTKDKVALVKVTESGEEELTSAAATVALNTWNCAKLTIEGKLAKAYLNGVKLFEYDAADVFTEGTIGLKAAGAVKFDNFAAYPIEAEEMRNYRTFKFTAPTVGDLSDWVLNASDWSIGNRFLTSQAASGTAAAMLSNKKSADNYAAETEVVMSVDGIVGVIGRASADGDDYYMFRVNVNTGAELVKVIDGNETVMDSVTFLALYEDGVKLQPTATYDLKLQMYGDMVEGYINGKLVLRAEDAQQALTAGTSGIFGSKDAAFNYLTISKVEVVTGITVVDAEGNPIATESAPFEVFLGKVPDIKHTYLHVEYYGGAAEDILLDQTSVEAFDGTTTGLKQAKVEYRDATTTFYYNVTTREAAIAHLDQELKALHIPTDLSAEAAVKALFNRYSDLSAMELEGNAISKEAKDNLFAAMEAIEFLRYPELKGTDIVFEDRFETEDSAIRYNSDPALLLGQGNPGNWYVENGTMLQYKTEDHSYPVRLNTTNVVMDGNGMPENWEIRSVSVDVQFIDPTTRAGIYFCFGGSNEEFYYFHITDKSQRISLGKTNTSFKVLYCDQVEDPIELKAGVWYNIRVTLDGKGLIKCYVDDRLWIEWQDVPTVQNDNLLTHGSVGLYSSENFVRFDNLVVRGTDLPAADYEDIKSSIDLDYVGGTDVYEDDFDDEKTEGVINTNPSHWIELNTEDKWYIKDNNGNLVYAVKDNTAAKSHTWLHVFETNVDFSTKLKVTEKGYLPVVALSSRVIADESYIRGGYDFSMQKWFITTRMGADFEPVTTYSDVDAAAAAAFFSEGVELGIKAVGKTIELYADGVKVHTKDADLKTMPGRVGVYAEQCNVEIDDVVLKQLSGQGRVNDGVLEYYTNTGSSFHSILEMWDEEGNQILLLYQDGTQSISVDGGQTFTPDNRYGANGFKGNSSLELHDGSYINIKTRGGSGADKKERWVYHSNDGGKTWPKVGVVPINPDHNYAQPAEHINEVRMPDGTWRVFYTLTNGTLGCSETFYTDYVEGMDNFGEVWYASKNSPKDFTNSTGWNESYVIQISKDTKDLNGREVKAGTLIQYSSHNSLDSIRYTFSYDGGETWVGDYALPQIPCGTNSCCIKEDPYEPGTYYMTAPYNIPAGMGEAHPRFRVVLLRSYDGLNWEFLGDIDRWGQVTDGNHGYIMQQVNAYLAITEDYVFPTFSRSDQILADANNSHHKQIGRMYRFDKDKLEPYAVWPQEYIIPDKSITSIEVIPGKADVTLNDADPLAGSKIKVYYYDAEPDYIDLVDVMDLTKDLSEPRAFVTYLDDMTTVGEKSIVVDYKHFRTIYTVNVVMGDAPVISGAEQDKVYCVEKEITVTDANGDLASVTLNGEAVTLVDGKFTVAAKEGQQTIVATDKAGNVTTVKITVNAAHTGGEATCEHKAKCEVCEAEYGELAAHKGGEATCCDKAKCEVCGEEYGEKDAEKHTKEAKWSHTADKHSKAYECCGKVVVAEEAHKLTDGKCECGYEAPASGDNSETGDNTAIVLFGSLMALSVLVAGVLLIPDVRKKLFG